MTDDELKAIEARVNLATPGPWCWEQTGEKDNSWCVGVAIDENEQPLCGLIQYEDGQEIVEGIAENLQDGTFADGEFIAHARTDIPALIAEVRTLRKHIASHLKVESNLIATQTVSTMNHNQIYEAYKRMRESVAQGDRLHLKLIAERDEAREALRFYTDPYADDGGAIARKALGEG